MARQEPKRRPTQAQLKRSQKRLIGFIAKTGDALDVTAVKLKVTRKQLESFLFQPVKTTRKAFNRTNAYSRLYEELGKSGPIAGVKRIPKIKVERYVDDYGEIRETVHVGGSYRYTHYADRGEIKSKRQYVAPKGISAESRRRARILTHSSMMEYKTTEAQATIEWQIYASEKNVPTSIMDIKGMYQEGLLNASTVNALMTHWRQIYGIDDDYYDAVIEDMGLDDYEI